MVFEVMEVIMPDHAKKWHSVTPPPSEGFDPDQFRFETEFLTPSEFELHLLSAPRRQVAGRGG
jgi:hypothetical protein